MAAIKPHLAQEGENSALQNEYWSCAGGRRGLGGLGDGEVCPAPEEIAQEAHAELMNVAWIRQALIEKMAGRKIWIAYDNNGTPAIAIDRPVTGPAWNPSAGARQTTILGWTTKMGAPSFSLPAGAREMGGACPGASAGQSVVPQGQRAEFSKKVLRVLKEHRGANPEVHSVNITRAVCEFCYAEGGQYATSGVQNAQLMRYAWATRAINNPGHEDGVSEFYSVMLDAIDRADWQSHQEPEHFKPKRFFRIHDSGDFFKLKYLEEWKKITLYYHHEVGGEGLSFNADGSINTLGSGHPEPVWFWAPTRIWASGPKLVTEVTKLNNQTVVEGKVENARENFDRLIGKGFSAFKVTGPKGEKGDIIREFDPTEGRMIYDFGDNFAIRPSAYHINEYGPFISGWAAPSTVYEHKYKPEGQDKAFNWDCQAYAAAKGPSCRGALSNPKGPGKGERGCRECWLNNDSAVNYTLHL